jgi:peptidoglycan/xylan/chitin deacetylase (PgdA/CDA1 family)
LWWTALAEIVERADEIELCRDGALWRLPTRTVHEKWRGYDQIYWWLRILDEPVQRRIVRGLAERHDIDMAALCRTLVLDWNELRALASDPLVTIGAHSKGHYAIAKLSLDEAREEMAGSAEAIERELGVRPAHFAFPLWR